MDTINGHILMVFVTVRHLSETGFSETEIYSQGLHWGLLTGTIPFREQKKQDWGFPGASVVKNLPANAGGTGSIPGPGRAHLPWSN